MNGYRVRTSNRALAAFIAGLAMGVTASGGTALLLYTGQGFLRAAGLLLSATVLAIAAGIWAGVPTGAADRPTPSRTRWVAFVLVLLAGAAFAGAWSNSEPLRNSAIGNAVAVLLVIALPAYAAGALIAGLNARDNARRPRVQPGSVPITAAAGAAVGILVATATLINSFGAFSLYAGAAAAVALASLLDRGWGPLPLRGDTLMIDHVALITGVGREGQLGYAIAQRFLAAGARIVITSRSPDIATLASELARFGDVIGVRADLTLNDDVRHLVVVVRERFGRLDSVVNAVGGLTLSKPIADTTPEEWHAEIERNTETVLRVCRAALPMLRESHGAIINFTSPAGERAVANLGAYSAAKAGVIAFTRALALEEIAHGVRVNAIAPGTMDTLQNIESATGTPKYVTRDAVAAVALFLAGRDGAGISGDTIHVPGPTLR